MTEIRAEKLAADLLRKGHTVDQVVDATALEPREVLAIAQKLKTHQRAPEFASLVDLADRVNSQAVLAKYPRKAQTLLTRAADLIMRAHDAVEEDAGKAALRAKRDKLKAELEKVNAELRGTPAAQAVDMKKARAWAIANGYDVPKAGRLKNDIVAAYLKAAA